MEIIRPDGIVERITTISENKENATIFRHFKGSLYKIVTIAKDSDTLEDMIVYEGQYENNPCWIREKSDFFSLLDSEKYPNIKQKYRFEIIKSKKDA